MREVKVCLIGSGRAGMVHAHNYTGSVPNARIIAVCDPVEETAKNAAEELGIEQYYTDYRDVLKNDEINAVYIVTPTKYHKEIAVAAAQAKKHIFPIKTIRFTF